MKQVYILAVFLIAAMSQLPPQTPIIGIVTQTYRNSSTEKSSYIAASYIKFIEMSGAQVVPIYGFANTNDLLALLRNVNGVVFTGGGMDFDINTQWTKNQDTIFKYAIQQNDQGNPFPIFGICMGIQLQAYLTSKYNDAIITRVNGDEAIIHPLNFVSDGYIFHTLNSAQMQKLSKGAGIMYFNHNWAITMDTFNNDPYLKSFWSLLATATTPRNEKFVAAWEAKKYPFYGVQFHPEKSPFEWKVFADRSIEAIEVTQIFSNRFVEIARKNKNRFSSVEDFVKKSIYNFQPIQAEGSSFTQTYVFNEIPVNQILLQM